MPSPRRLLPDDEVHVWWLSLRAEARPVEQALNQLSPEERKRADRYHFARDRDRFILGRAFLRSLLGEYTNQEPNRVSLRVSPAGKPFLSRRFSLEFNLSHCEDRGVIALARHPVGIDLERLREVSEASAIAENLFTVSENRALRAFPAPLQSEAFLRCWTRKEAYVKARGVGLLTPLASFEVTLDPSFPQLDLLQEAGGLHWRLYELEAGSGWVGALAIEREPGRIVNRHFPG